MRVTKLYHSRAMSGRRCGSLLKSLDAISMMDTRRSNKLDECASAAGRGSYQDQRDISTCFAKLEGRMSDEEQEIMRMRCYEKDETSGLDREQMRTQPWDCGSKATVKMCVSRRALQNKHRRRCMLLLSRRLTEILVRDRNKNELLTCQLQKARIRSSDGSPVLTI